MLKHIPTVAGVVLGLAFIMAGMMVLLDMVPEQEPPPEGSAAEAFFAAFWPTGYLKFIKVLEVVGGVLVAIPITRRLGLVVLTPIVVNILAFHVFVMEGEGLFDPMVIVVTVMTAFLLWVERATLVGLVGRRSVRVKTA